MMFDDRPKFKVRLENGGWSTVRAERVEGFFAVHHERAKIKWFCVTHGFTGMKVVSYVRLEDAIRVMNRLNAHRELFKFTLPAEISPAARDLVSRIQKELHPRSAFSWRYL